MLQLGAVTIERKLAALYERPGKVRRKKEREEKRWREG